MTDITYRPDGSVVIKTELRTSSYATMMVALTQQYLSDLYYFIFTRISYRLYNKTLFNTHCNKIDDNAYIDKFDEHRYYPEYYTYTDKKTKKNVYLKLDHITSTAKHKITHFAIEDAMEYGIWYIKWCTYSNHKYSNPKYAKYFFKNVVEDYMKTNYNPRLGYVPQSIDYSVIEKFKYGKRDKITGDYENLGRYLIPKIKEHATIISESDKLLIQRYLLGGYHRKHLSLYTRWYTDLYLSMHLVPTEESGVFKHLRFIRKDV